VSPDPHPSTTALAYQDVFALRDELRAGRATSEEVVEGLLDRIAALDAPQSPTSLRSVLAVSERAMAEAKRCDQAPDGSSRGPLHGIPVLVKDNIEVAGMPGSAGATSLTGRSPEADAPLVARLRQAGAIILGTTNLSQWANLRSPRSTSGWSAVGGLTANPWALDRSAGGSSSGSGAALAAGLAPLAVGTETDGSIVCPASLNGVAGIKPSVGAVPTVGVVPLSSSQDSPGPMARSVREVALLLEVLTGVNGILDRVAGGIADLRVAVARTWRSGHPATDALFDDTVHHFEDAGARLHYVDATLPGESDQEDEATVLLCEMCDELTAYLASRPGAGPGSVAEVIEHERKNAPVEMAHFGHEHFERAVALGGRSSDAYRQARSRNLAWALGACLEPALAEADLLVAPSYGPAWKSDLVLGDHLALASPVTMAPAIAGWPIAAVPMGLVEGLPVGLALVGRPGSEGTLLAAAHAIEIGVGLVSSGGLRPTWLTPRRG
jgi:amidase